MADEKRVDRDGEPAHQATGQRADPARALRWIVDLLGSQGIPFQVAGGLAARAYGSIRPLADIDLYVPGAHLAQVAAEAGPYVTFGPERHRGEQWDLTFMKLCYAGQMIELGDSDDTRYLDAASGRWHRAEIDYRASVVLEVLGLEVPVMPLASLVEYKRRLNRDVDLIDLAAIHEPA